jgi:hypothetical protein
MTSPGPLPAHDPASRTRSFGGRRRDAGQHPASMMRPLIVLAVLAALAGACAAGTSPAPPSAPSPSGAAGTPVAPPPSPMPPASSDPTPAGSPASPPAFDWEVRDLDVTGGLLDVVAGGPGFVAVGYRTWEPALSTAWTSTDGITWSEVPGPGGFDRGALVAAASGPGAIVGVGRANGEGWVTGASFWRSPDGLRWSATGSPPQCGACDMRTALWWGGGFWAGGTSGAGVATLFASVDGTGWSVAWKDPEPPDGPGLRAGTWVSALAGFSGGLAAAVEDSAGSPGASIRVSADGARWRTLAFPDKGAAVTGLAAWGNGLLAVGADGQAEAHGAVWISVDAQTWRRVADLGAGRASDVAVNGGRAVVTAHGADGTPAVVVSTDGETWAAMSLPPEAVAWTFAESLVPFGGGFLGVGAIGGNEGIGTGRLAVWRTTRLGAAP